jgi:hypothetical protein
MSLQRRLVLRKLYLDVFEAFFYITPFWVSASLEAFFYHCHSDLVPQWNLQGAPLQEQMTNYSN